MYEVPRPRFSDACYLQLTNNEQLLAGGGVVSETLVTNGRNNSCLWLDGLLYLMIPVATASLVLNHPLKRFKTTPGASLI